MVALYAVLLPRWRHVAPELRRWVLEELVRLQASGAASGRIDSVIFRLDTWLALCAEVVGGGAGLPEKCHPHDTRSCGVHEDGWNLLAAR